METLVELYDSFEAAQETVHALEQAGFSRGDISLVAHSDVIVHGRGKGSGTAAGVAVGAGIGLAAGLATILVPGIGWVAALGPILFGGAMGAVVGGVVGSLMDAGIPADEAESYAEGVRRGGTLVTITVDEEDADRASDVMERHFPVDLTAREAEWRLGGWTAPQTSTPPGTAPISGKTSINPGGADRISSASAPAMAPNFAIAAPGIQPTREDESEAPDEIIVVEVTGDVSPDTGGIAHAQVDEEFHDDFDRNFPGDYLWEETRPAYWFGYRAGLGDSESNWSAMEPRIRAGWEHDHPANWNRVKDAARFGYDRSKGPALD